MCLYPLLQECLLRLFSTQLALRVQHDGLVQDRLGSNVLPHDLDFHLISTALCFRAKANVERLALVVDVDDKLLVVLLREAGC